MVPEDQSGAPPSAAMLIVDLVNAALWPAIALLALLIFYGPVHTTLSSISRRSEQIETIKVGQLELTIRKADLRVPSPEAATVLTSFDEDMLLYLLSITPGATGGYCSAENATADPKQAAERKLAQLGQLESVREETRDSWCPTRAALP